MEVTNDATAVQAVTAGVLWGVDRVTFRDIIVASAAARRARFDGALAAMPIFSGLTPEQRAAIAVSARLCIRLNLLLSGKQCRLCIRLNFLQLENSVGHAAKHPVKRCAVFQVLRSASGSGGNM